MKVLDTRIANLEQAIENTEYLIAHERDPQKQAEHLARLKAFIEKMCVVRKAAGIG
jgi:hypothetical protein